MTRSRWFSMTLGAALLAGAACAEETGGDCALSACGAPCGPAAPASATACEPAPSHVCSDAGECLARDQVSCAMPPPSPEGWDDAPGAGRAFVVDALRIAGADAASEGADACAATAPRNQLAPLAVLDEQLRQGVLGGEAMILVELTGLDEPFTGTDDGATLGLHAARDADEPFFPGNNFRSIDGEPCCEFLVEPEAVMGSPARARARTPLKLAGDALRTLSPVAAELPFAPGLRARIDAISISGRVRPGLTGLDLTLSGAWTVADLAASKSPFCRTASPACPAPVEGASMLDLVLATTGAQPALDLDLDGLESFHDDDGDGRIDRCVDGCAGACTTPVVLSSTPDSPCATHPRFADAYSITFEVSAVPARILGIAR